MKKIILLLSLSFFISTTSTAQTENFLLECHTAGISHGNDFFLKDDKTLTVSTSGWVNHTFVKNAPATFKNGKIISQEISVFENEQPIVSIKEKKVVLISEPTEKYIILIDKDSIESSDDRYVFNGTVLKGAMKVGGELYDSLYCFGNSQTLNF